MTSDGATRSRDVAREDPRKERSRRRALAAAAELLLARGLASLTVEAIAARSGVAKTTIYRHWPTRRDLVEAAFWRVAPPPAEPARGGPVVDRLADPLLRAASLFMDHPVLPSLIEAVLRDPELAEFHDRFVRAQTREVRDVLAGAERDGELAPGLTAPEALELSLGALMVRAGLHRRPIALADARAIAALVTTRDPGTPAAQAARAGAGQPP